MLPSSAVLVCWQSGAMPGCVGPRVAKLEVGVELMIANEEDVSSL